MLAVKPAVSPPRVYFLFSILLLWQMIPSNMPHLANGKLEFKQDLAGSVLATIYLGCRLVHGPRKDDLQFWPPTTGRPVVRSRSRHDCNFIRGTSFIAGKQVCLPSIPFPPCVENVFFLSGVSHLFFFIFLCHIFYFLLKWIICNFFLYYLFPGSTLVNRLTSQLPEYCTSLAVAYNAVALPLLYKFYSDPDPVQNLSAHPNPGVRFNAGPKHCNL